MRNIDSCFPGSVLQSLWSASSIGEVVEAYKAYLQQFGVVNLLISGLPLADDRTWKRSIICDQWPREWYDRYLAMGHYRFDPCVRKCRETIHAFMWSELPDNDLKPRQRLVLNEAADFKMRDGFCIPIHRPSEAPAVITLSGEDVRMNASEQMIVEVLSNQLFRRICRLAGRYTDGPENSLTARELEVMQAVADGKSAADAGCIMGVSKHTIERHLLNIRVKTDSSNTTHAVAKALRAHQIY